MPELERSAGGQVVYRPDGEVLKDYVRDRSPFAVIRGPIGSGTSTGSCMRIFATALEQAKSPRDGLRHSRWAVVRNTYPELLTSTLKTWLQWFPEQPYGILNRARPMHQVIRIADLDLEVWFLALDHEDDVKKLRSTEFTGFWPNELEFFNYLIVNEMRSRAGRFPPMAEGGPTWYGVIADMNAPNEEHWLPRMAGEVPYPDDVPEDKRLEMPKSWAYFKQPPALIEVFGADGKTVVGYLLNPKAENLRWLPDGYYEGLAQGASKNWIDSRLMNRITYVVDGDPVWVGVKQELVFAQGPLDYLPGREVIVSLDFGRRPTAIMAQEIGDKIHVQREFRMYGVGAAVFAPQLKRFLEQNYRGAKIRFTGDPKGRDKGQGDERSAYDIFRSFGMVITPAPVRNNNLDDRLEAVSFALMMNRILVSGQCLTLRAALAGKYHFVKIDVGDVEPFKDKYSDVADCLQYLCLFLGEGRRMIGLEAGAAPKAMKVHAGRRSMRRVSA